MHECKIQAILNMLQDVAALFIVHHHQYGQVNSHLAAAAWHRLYRGTLLAIGRPDGRLCSQAKAERWVLLALQQARWACCCEHFCVPEIDRLDMPHSVLRAQQVLSLVGGSKWTDPTILIPFPFCKPIMPSYHSLFQPCNCRDQLVPQAPEASPITLCHPPI